MTPLTPVLFMDIDKFHKAIFYNSPTAKYTTSVFKE